MLRTNRYDVTTLIIAICGSIFSLSRNDYANSWTWSANTDMSPISSRRDEVMILSAFLPLVQENSQSVVGHVPTKVLMFLMTLIIFHRHQSQSLLYIYLYFSWIHYRWIYTLFTATDANYKQKARAQRNDRRDLPLGPGWGATVESVQYNVHIDKHAKGKDEEVRSTILIVSVVYGTVVPI